jgi:hypothetical protein
MRLGAAKAMTPEGTTAACSGATTWMLPPKGSIGALCRSSTWTNSVGAAAGAGAQSTCYSWTGPLDSPAHWL